MWVTVPFSRKIDVFQGRVNLNLDSKGRLAVPTKYRETPAIIESAGKLVITADSLNYLLIYPLHEWTIVQQNLMKLSNANPMVKKLQRMLIGNAQEVEIDSSGRILISPELRKHAGLDKSVMLVGLGQKFELWDEAKWNAEMNAPINLEEVGSNLDGFSW